LVSAHREDAVAAIDTVCAILVGGALGRCHDAILGLGSVQTPITRKWWSFWATTDLCDTEASLCTNQATLTIAVNGTWPQVGRELSHVDDVDIVGVFDVTARVSDADDIGVVTRIQCDRLG